MGIVSLAAIALDTLVNLLRVGCIVGGGSLHKTQRKLQVRRGLGEVAVVIARDGHDLPHIWTAEEPRATTRRTIREADERVLVHAQPLLYIALRKRARRHVRAVGAVGEPANGSFREADAERYGGHLYRMVTLQSTVRRRLIVPNGNIAYHSRKHSDDSANPSARFSGGSFPSRPSGFDHVVSASNATT